MPNEAKFVSKFKAAKSFDERVQLSQKLIDHHENHIPVVVEAVEKKKNEPSSLRQSKFLTSADQTVARFQVEVRKYLTLGSGEAVRFLLEKDLMLDPGMTMAALYTQNKDPDGFLYVYCVKEATLG